MRKKLRSPEETCESLKRPSHAEVQQRRTAINSELCEALYHWVNKQSNENELRLYGAALAYFGIKPVIPD